MFERFCVQHWSKLREQLLRKCCRKIADAAHQYKMHGEYIPKYSVLYTLEPHKTYGAFERLLGEDGPDFRGNQTIEYDTVENLC